MRYSQRKSLTRIKDVVQRESMDAPLRSKLWSVLVAHFFGPVIGTTWSSLGSPQKEILSEIWRDFFAYPLDEKPSQWGTAQKEVKDWFFNQAQWYEVYDLMEFVIQQAPEPLQSTLIRETNRALEEEVSACRVVGAEIAELTDEQEVAAVEAALADAQLMPDVDLHLKAAIEKYSDRSSPDYRNSVKESISAVEALCQRIAGDRNATLGQALKQLESSGVTLHPALKAAWEKLYGYTSQSGGIRHALSDAASVGSGEAKYMLVSSASFIHYLIELSQKAGVKLT